MRGIPTKEIKVKAKELLGIEDLTYEEFHLMPYIQYVMVNEQKLNPDLVNSSERLILRRWKNNGWIEGGAGGLTITKEFWDAILELIWLGYVAYGEEKEQ